MMDDAQRGDYFVFQDWHNQYHDFTGVLENISGNIEDEIITLTFKASIPNQTRLKKYIAQIKLNK